MASGPFAGYYWLNYGHSSQTEWCAWHEVKNDKRYRYELSWNGSILFYRCSHIFKDGTVYYIVESRTTYRRTSGTTYLGYCETRFGDPRIPLWTEWKPRGTHVANLVSFSTGFTADAIQHYRSVVSARFHNWVHPLYNRPWEPLNDPDGAYYAGNASLNAANGFDAIKSNVIANVTELPEVGSTIPNIISDIKSPSARSAADAWLNYRYGDRLTYGDLQQMASSLREQYEVLSKDIVRKKYGAASHQRQFHDCSQTISYSCEIIARNGGVDLESTLRRIDELGSLPNVARAWDLVPYSFVVDWFLNVSECASIIDSWFKTSRMDIVCCIQSVKGEIIVPSSKLLGFGEGEIILTHYSRTVGREPAMPVMDLDHLITTPKAKNFLDGASLILGALK
jgi:hypothetical protein